MPSIVSDKSNSQRRSVKNNKLLKVFSSSIFVLLCSLLSPLLSAANDRVALVIGNADYQVMPLSNPENDALEMEKALKSVGFEVIRVLNADLKTMQKAVLEFSEKIQANSTALFFYAGHGIQTNGRNYLMPVDAAVESENAIRYEGLDVSDILEELEASQARVKLVVLDACRNNPFERKMRGASRGLVAVDAARGTLIAYATSPGSTAADGNGSNGLYTESLLNAIRQPGLKVEEVFKRVRIDVAKASNGAQIPWESSSLTGDFIFTPTTERSAKNLASTSSTVTVTTSSTVTKSTSVTASSAADTEEKNCSDLTGVWQNSAVNAALCPPKELTLKRAGPNDTYEVQGRGCGVPISGLAKLEGHTLEFKWTMTPCSGTTTFAMDEQCSSGNGPIKFNPGLLCHFKDNVGVIRR